MSLFDVMFGSSIRITEAKSLGICCFLSEANGIKFVSDAMLSSSFLGVILAIVVGSFLSDLLYCILLVKAVLEFFPVSRL